MSKNSKAYRAAAEKVDRTNLYTPLQAAKLAKETSSTKQDATVEVAIRLGVDPRKADQMVRGTVNLPHGTGKTARVAVFAVGEKAEQAQAAGADIVGSDDLIEKIQGGFLDFDAAIATPDQMAKVGRIARILGPHGVAIMDFCKAYNAQTESQRGTIVPVEITVYEDRSFTFITKTPPTPVLLREAAGIAKGSQNPGKEGAGSVTADQVRSIAETKLPDLNAHDIDAAIKQVEGTARSMGLQVV